MSVHTTSSAPALQGRRYATVDRAAEYASVSAKTVRRLLDSGRLTRFSVGARIVRVDLNEVDRLLSGWDGNVER